MVKEIKNLDLRQRFMGTEGFDTFRLAGSELSLRKSMSLWLMTSSSVEMFADANRYVLLHVLLRARTNLRDEGKLANTASLHPHGRRRYAGFNVPGFSHTIVRIIMNNSRYPRLSQLHSDAVG